MQDRAVVLINRDQPKVGTIIFIFDRALLEVGELLGLDAVGEGTRGIGIRAGEIDGYARRTDRRLVQGMARIEFLIVSVARAWVGQHDDARLSAIDAGQP